MHACTGRSASGSGGASKQVDAGVGREWCRSYDLTKPLGAEALQHTRLVGAGFGAVLGRGLEHGLLRAGADAALGAGAGVLGMLGAGRASRAGLFPRVMPQL